MIVTVDEARNEVMSKLDKGVVCPCCNQFARRYRRAMNGTMAAGLCALVKEYLTTKDWVYIGDLPFGKHSDLRSAGGQFAKLVHWNLIVSKPRDESTRGRTTGFWKPTERGVDFALSRRMEPDCLFIYNNQVQARSSNMILIRDALDETFDYLTLMGAHLNLNDNQLQLRI